MNFEEIYKAAMDGRTFRFIGKINELSYENGNLKIDWVFPEVGKPFNRNHDFTYIELAPKYDPCREFRAGDKVELKTNLGRNPYDTFDGQEYIPDGTVFTVLRDEWAGGKVDIFEKDESDAFTVHFSNLELVTPVEELEPYSVLESGVIDGFDILRDELCVMTFPYGSKEAGYYRNKLAAKEAAEAERDRLNAEYRKEQE